MRQAVYEPLSFGYSCLGHAAGTFWSGFKENNGSEGV
jgi:hypothetical protein